MVMRNKHDGAGPSWWDDLPPAVKQRVTPGQPAEAADSQLPVPEQPYRPAVVSDLSRLAVLFFGVALANLLFLLLALSFLSGRAPFGG